MRRLLTGSIVLFALVAGSAVAQEGQPEDAAARVTKALTDADPLAEASKSGLLAPDRDTERAIVKLAFSDATPEPVRERALRLSMAFNRVDRVAENAAAGDHSTVFWLALDELDRELAKGPRETLLARALPDAKQRDALLAELAAAREVATRFCREWNEIETDAEQTKKHAALRTDLEKAGSAALPYLATTLAIPPQAVFAVMDEERGITARCQVRALFALSFLKAKSLLPQIVYHVRGPSFTQCATARDALRELAGLKYPEDGGEAAELKVIDAWWRKDASVSWAGDHLARHALRWARMELATDDPERGYRSSFAPMQLAKVWDRDYAIDAKAPAAERAARLAELERAAIRACPDCIR